MSIKDITIFLNKDYPLELDFFWEDLVISFFKFLETGDDLEFQMKGNYFIQIIQSPPIRTRFENLKWRMKRLHIMILIWKLLK
jgi:hypothetical protein